MKNMFSLSSLFSAAAFTVMASVSQISMAEESGESANSLATAYKKEFTFLETQKAELQRRIAQAKKNIELEQSAIMIEIDQFEAKKLAVDEKVERLNDLINDSEREIEANESNTNVLQGTFEQAAASLEDYGVSFLSDESYAQASDEQKLESVFSQAIDTLSKMSATQKQSGQFFLLDGTETQGEIIKLGNVAAYGVSDKASGVLAPAGGGELKLWNDTTASVAQKLNSGESVSELPVFLFESLKSDVQQQGEETFLDVINSGGIIGWVIVGLGCLGLLLVLLRAVFLQSASLSRGKIQKSVSQLVSKGDVNSAMKVCKKEKGATSRVLMDTLRNLGRQRDHLEDIISESILHESGALNRFGAFILVIAAVSPLLGLLGTVTGMISTFDVITEFGTGDPRLLSGGISTALVTTELGLIVAIPLLILGNLLSGWSNRIKDDLEKAALHVTNKHQVYLDGQR